MTNSIVDDLGLSEPPALAKKGAKRAFETFCTQLETRVDFFYFFARNPLKSPDSDEQIQANPRKFAWFCLDLLGRISRHGCICRSEGSLRRRFPLMVPRLGPLFVITYLTRVEIHVAMHNMTPGMKRRGRIGEVEHE